MSLPIKVFVMNPSSSSPTEKYEMRGQISLTSESTIIKHTWIIKKFSGLLNEAKFSISPAFTTNTNDIKINWCLFLTLKTSSKNDSKHICICVRCLGSNNIDASYKLGILKSDGTTFDLPLIDREFITGIWEAISIQQLNSLLNEKDIFFPNDELKITFDIETLTKGDEVIERNRERAKQMLRLEEFNKFEDFFDNKDFSDMIFKVDEKEIHACRIILAARNPVFRAMFLHNTLEKKHKVVEIKDIDYNAFYEVVRYIYCGKINANNCSVENILIAAERYCVDGLKEECELHLQKNLQIDNALVYLDLADFHNALMLKKEAMKFIKFHENDIIQSLSFEMNINLGTDAAKNVYNDLAKKRRKMTIVCL